MLCPYDWNIIFVRPFYKECFIPHRQVNSQRQGWARHASPSTVILMMARGARLMVHPHSYLSPPGREDKKYPLTLILSHVGERKSNIE
jgi:hypothetical protein